MPSGRNAKYNEWSIWFEKLFPYLNEEIILIGHSLGATFLIKYISENILPIHINQIHLVAGAICIKGGFGYNDSLDKIEKQCNNIFIYHSIDDPVVDFEDALKYQKMLTNAKFEQFEDRGHFLQEKFPEIVGNIKNT
jgi:predicted alpha/beta hydrolase family esterase